LHVVLEELWLWERITGFTYTWEHIGIIELNQEKYNIGYQYVTTRALVQTWKFILQTIASILTAIATTLGVTSCI